MSTKAKEPKKTTRLDIVEDCLALLATKKFIPTTRRYLDLDESICKIFYGKSLQKALKSKRWKPCTGCAMGLIFLARVDRDNKVNVPEVSGMSDGVMVETVKDLFPEPHLRLIEAAFEGHVWKDASYFSNIPDSDNRPRFGLNDTGYQTYLAAVDFGRQHDTPKARLKAILLNMKKNDGWFNPPPPPFPIFLGKPQQTGQHES